MDEILTQCPVCKSSHFAVLDAVAGLDQCQPCSFVFANPRPSLSDLEHYYSKPSKYEDWLSNEAERDHLWRRRLKKMGKTKTQGTLLDVGTGIGQFLNHAKGLYTAVFGTELSDSAINIARNKYGLDIMKGDLESISFSRRFDNISLFHILEHVHDPRRLLEKCYQLLNPGGKIVIAVPNDLYSWELKIRTAIRRWKGVLSCTTGWTGIAKIALDGSVDEIHLSQFSVASLRKLLTDVGYEIAQESLDPFFAKRGFKLFVFQSYYTLHRLLHILFGINRYNTIWMVGKRPLDA